MTSVEPLRALLTLSVRPPYPAIQNAPALVEKVGDRKNPGPSLADRRRCARSAPNLGARAKPAAHQSHLRGRGPRARAQPVCRCRQGERQAKKPRRVAGRRLTGKGYWDEGCTPLVDFRHSPPSTASAGVSLVCGGHHCLHPTVLFDPPHTKTGHPLLAPSKQEGSPLPCRGAGVLAGCCKSCLKIVPFYLRHFPVPKSV